MAQSNIFLRVAMFAVWLVLLVICVLAYTGEMGKSIASIATSNNTPLTPMNYTFYSLAIIGILEGVGCVYALFPQGYEGPKKDRWKTRTVNTVGPWWVVGFACQILWLILWVQNVLATYIISLGLQVAGLLSFAIAYGLLMRMTKEHNRTRVSLPSYVFLYIPTIMNLAWLTIATCIGLLSIITQEHPKLITDKPEGFQAGALVLAAVVTFVGLLIEGFHLSIFYGLTLIWTFTGVYIKKRDDKHRVMEQGILVCLILLCLVTAFSITYSIFKCFKKTDEKNEPLNTSSDEEGEKEQDVV